MSVFLVTFATHSERYFPLLSSYPRLHVLGYGSQWTGWYGRVQSILELMKNKSNDDILCFVDGFDSIVLSDNLEDELYDKFKDCNTDILFSADIPPNKIGHYFRDRIFGTCDQELLSAGMYVGYCGALKQFWKDMKPGDDDQKYATKTCRLQKDKDITVKIDVDCNIFFNYYKGHQILVKNRRIIVKENRPCLLSAPGYQDIENILHCLELPLVYKAKFGKALLDYYIDKVKTFWTYFIFELIVFFIVVLLIIVYCTYTRCLYKK